MMTLIEEIRQNAVLRSFLDNIHSGQIKSPSPDCQLCSEAAKWSCERVWQALFTAEILMTQNQLKLSWSIASRAILSCPTEEVALMAELYLIRVQVAYRRGGSTRDCEVQIEAFNQLVSNATPVLPLHIRVLAAAMKTILALPRPTASEVKRWLNHVVFDGGQQYKNEFQEIFDNIRRLEKQRRINNKPSAPVLWGGASIKDQKELFSRPSNSSDRSSFRVQYSPEKGRHWIATKNVAPGQLVWVEESGPAVGYDNSGGLHCYTCLTPTCSLSAAVDPSFQQHLLCCKACNQASFCCRECYDNGIGSHMEECKNRHYFHEAAFGGGTYQQNLIGLVIKIAKCLQQRDQEWDCGFFSNPMTNEDSMPCLESDPLVDSTDIWRLNVPGTGFDPEMKEGVGWWAVLLEEVIRGFKNMAPLFLRLILTACNNAHGIGDVDKDVEPWGYGLYPRAVFINHSCDPNIRKVFTESGQMALYAVREILKGEEICDCYGKMTSSRIRSTRVRRKVLQRNFGFFCQCQECSSQE